MNPWLTPIGWTLLTLGQILLVILPGLVCIAFLLLLDRKVWAGVQLRKGPNVVGPFGLFQSFADLFKFILKEPIIPAGADRFVFLLAPLVFFVLAFLGWAAVPFAPGWVVADINVGILYLLAMSSLGVYGVIMGGWASNSKFPFLAALRSAAQMVSYEVSIGFVIITVVLLSGSMNVQTIIAKQGGGFWHWNLFGGGLSGLPLVVIMAPMMVIFFVSALAETNRPPFDLIEAESELVAGYQTEYSSSPYLVFMIGEYVNIVLQSAMISILFLGGWQAPWPTPYLNHMPGAFVGYWNFWLFHVDKESVWNLLVSLHGFAFFFAKLVFWFFMFAMVKAIVPRYRYDQLMRLGWKVFLPTSLVAVALVAAWRVFGPAAA